MKIILKAHYINLDSSPERDRLIRENIEMVGMTNLFNRFPAIDGKDFWTVNDKIGKSELGCFLSHETLLKSQGNNELTLIIEDDTFLPKDFKLNIINLARRILKEPANVDVIFLGQTINHRDIDRAKELIRIQSNIKDKNRDGSYNFVFLEGKSWYKWGMFAYLLMPGSGKKIHRLIEGIAHHEMPIDDLIGTLIKEDKIQAKVIFPYLVGLNEPPTTMHDRKFNIDNKIQVDLVNLFTHNGNIDKLIEGAYANLQSSDFNESAFIYSQLIYQKLTGIG